MAQAPLPPAPDSSKCPGVQESVAKILCARRWVAAYGVCEVEGVFWGFFPLGKSWNAQRFQQGEHRQNEKKFPIRIQTQPNGRLLFLFEGFFKWIFHLALEAFERR